MARSAYRGIFVDISRLIEAPPVYRDARGEMTSESISGGRRRAS